MQGLIKMNDLRQLNDNEYLKNIKLSSFNFMMK